MRKFTFFLAMMVAMVTTSFAQTPVLEFSAEQIGTQYPYQLNEEDAAKIVRSEFVKNNGYKLNDSKIL